MNAPEKFNQTIEKIEELVSDPAISTTEIGQIIATCNGLGVRDMSSVFRYLVDKTLNEYIVERKLTAAYRHLATSTEKGKTISAIEIAGYGDQPSFSKAFKRLFGITPGEAQRKKDLSLISSPPTWDFLSGNLSSVIQAEEREAVMEEQVFGISESSFEKVTQVLDLEAFYGFSSMFSKYAFELSEKTEHSLEDCFKYVASLRDFGGDYKTGYVDEFTPVERLHEDGDNEVFQKLFFTLGISVSMSWSLIYEHNVKLDTLFNCDPRMLMYFPGFEEGVEISFDYYARAFQYYIQHFDIEETEDGFENYLDLVLSGTPIEEALTDISDDVEFDRSLKCGEFPYDDIDIDEDMAEFERYSALDALADEEARWHGKRIDDDLYYDPENITLNQFYQEHEEW